MMNGSEVMYHQHHSPYHSYFYHQRSSHTAHPHTTAIDQLKKFGLGKLADATDLTARSACLLPTLSASYATHNQTTPAVTSGGVSRESKQSNCSLVIPKEEPNKSKNEEGERASPTPANAQYLSASCVLLTYFNGDTSANVDEHFSRALNQTSANQSDDNSSTSKSSHSGNRWKGPSPMSERNFPASFWNSHYQPPSSSSLIAPGLSGHQIASDISASSLSSTDNPYPHHVTPTVTFHAPGIGGGLQDPWRYPLPGASTSQTYPHHHTHHHHHHSLQDFSYSSARFNSYGSLLPPGRGLGSVATQCDPLSKHHGDAWTAAGGRFGFSEGLAHHDGLHPGGNIAGGIDGCAIPTAASKDTVYWF